MMKMLRARMDRQHAKETFQNIWEGLKLHLLRSIFCSSLKDWEEPASRANMKGTGNQSVRAGLKLKEPALWPPRLLGNLEAVQEQIQVSGLSQLILRALTGLEQSITCLLLSLKLYISYFGPKPFSMIKCRNPSAWKKRSSGTHFFEG